MVLSCLQHHVWFKPAHLLSDLHRSGRDRIAKHTHPCAGRCQRTCFLRVRVTVLQPDNITHPCGLGVPVMLPWCPWGKLKLRGFWKYSLLKQGLHPHPRVVPAPFFSTSRALLFPAFFSASHPITTRNRCSRNESLFLLLPLGYCPKTGVAKKKVF